MEKTRQIASNLRVRSVGNRNLLQKRVNGMWVTCLWEFEPRALPEGVTLAGNYGVSVETLYPEEIEITE